MANKYKIVFRKIISMGRVYKNLILDKFPRFDFTNSFFVNVTKPNNIFTMYVTDGEYIQDATTWSGRMIELSEEVSPSVEHFNIIHDYIS